MGLSNAFGGLGLDETLKQLIERFRDWKDPSWVTSHPEMPVHVAGKVGVMDDPFITGATRVITSTTAAQIFCQPNQLRTGVAIYNVAASATLYILAANVFNVPVSQTTVVGAGYFSVPILAGQYWELPQSPKGCYKGLITGAWSSADTSATVTEWSGSAV